MSLFLDFSVVVGSRLVRSDDLDLSDPRVAHAVQRTPLDGALIVKIGSATVLDEHLWDRLDEIMSDLGPLLDGLERGALPATLHFPETRVSLQLDSESKGQMRINCETLSAVCPIDDFVRLGRALIQKFEHFRCT